MTLALRPFPLEIDPDRFAEALAQENASNKALRRNGFAFAGEVEDPEDGLVWRWERRAP